MKNPDKRGACCAQEQSSSPCCSAQRPAGANLGTRQVVIEFMYLDLAECARCQGSEASLEEAIAEVAGVLEAAGSDVTLHKIHVQTEDQARELGFVSSPTIRVNGRDLQLEVRETPCGPCGDLAGEPVDCRAWVWQGEEHEVPPKAMIVDAVLREVYGGERSGSREAPPDRGVPENLKRFFAARRREGEGSCCGPSGPARCCH